MVATNDHGTSGSAQLTVDFNLTNPQDDTKGLDALLAISDITTLQALVAQHQISPLTYTRRLETLVNTLQKELHVAHTRIEELGGELVATSEALAAETESRAAAEAAKKIDALTGLPNRGAFDEALAGILAEDDENDADDITCLVFIDIDGLKQTNDCYGHPAGDRLLLAAVALFQQRLRGNDEMFRVGGDEVTLLMRGKPEIIMSRMLKMQQELEKILIRAEVAAEWKDIPVWGFSFGIHQIDKQQSVEENYQAADAQMYKNKEFRKASQSELRALRTSIMLVDKETHKLYSDWHQRIVANDIAPPPSAAPTPP